MLLKQYGGAKGVQEISGLGNLLNPIGIISVLLFIMGVWISFKISIINRVLSILWLLLILSLIN